MVYWTLLICYKLGGLMSNKTIAQRVCSIPDGVAFDSAVYRLSVCSSEHDHIRTDGTKYQQRIYVFVDGSWLVAENDYLEDGSLGETSAYCLTGQA